MDTQLSQLSAAIDKLYHAFAAYPLAARIEGCPCCVSAEDDAALHALPLRELPAANLARFAHKAMTTWGDVADYKHFLPRILEVEATEPEAFFGIGGTLGKLVHARWEDWPAHEQEAVAGVLMALWRRALGAPVGHADPWRFARDLDLVGLGDACRQEWLACTLREAALHLAGAVLAGAEDPWLLDPRVRTLLERAFFRWEDAPVSDAHWTLAIRAGDAPVPAG